VGHVEPITSYLVLCFIMMNKMKFVPGYFIRRVLPRDHRKLGEWTAVLLSVNATEDDRTWST